MELDVKADLSTGLGVVFRSSGDFDLLVVGIREKVWILLVDFVSTSTEVASTIPLGEKELLISLASLFKSAVPSAMMIEEGLLPLDPFDPLRLPDEPDEYPLLPVRRTGIFCCELGVAFPLGVLSVTCPTEFVLAWENLREEAL